MTTQPEALRLADWIQNDAWFCPQCDDLAAELRRLHSSSLTLREELKTLLAIYQDPTRPFSAVAVRSAAKAIKRAEG
jgi:hypothetical protein